MNTFLRTASVVLALGALALTSACAGAGGGSGGGTSDRVVAIGVASDITETIPSSSIVTTNTFVIMHMYDSLLTLPVEGTTPGPGLATGWELSEDRLEYTFTIREGVVFHDGAPLTAEDVVWTLDYVREDPNMASTMSNIAEVRSDEPLTVTVVLAAPQPDLPIILAGPSLGILPADFGGKSAEEFRVSPQGTGPYTWGSRTVGTDIRMERFDDYWGGAPSNAGLHFKVFEDVNAQALAFQTGEVDLVWDVSPDAASLFVGTEIISAPESVEFVQLNSNVPILQDAGFRRALSLGIDREELTTSLLSGFGEPARSILPKVVFPDGVPEVADAPYHLDQEEARALVEASAYDGTPLRLVYPGGTGIDPAFATALQEQWKEIGIAIELVPKESAAWLDAVTAPSPHDAFDLSISMDGGSAPTGILGFLADSQIYGGGWPVERVEQAALDFCSSSDADEEQAALTGFEEWVARELPTIPIAYMSTATIAVPELRGIASGSSHYFPLNKVVVG